MNTQMYSPQSASAPPVAEARRYPRSRQMIDCLKEHFIYSEKRARDFLFRAIEDLVSAEGPIMVSRLTREAASRAREHGRGEGYEFAAWETAAKAVVNSMLVAGVLRTHAGNMIRPGIAAQATAVTALQDGYRDTTESYLLEFLVIKLGDVTTRDHTALAHALFRQFDPNVPMQDLEDRVVVLLAGLEGRIVLLNRGVYTACASDESSQRN